MLSEFCTWRYEEVDEWITGQIQTWMVLEINTVPIIHRACAGLYMLKRSGVWKEDFVICTVSLVGLFGLFDLVDPCNT